MNPKPVGGISADSHFVGSDNIASDFFNTAFKSIGCVGRNVGPAFDAPGGQAGAEAKARS